MKLKKLFSAIGLGLFAVASVSAGVLAFAKGPRMEMAKAEGEKTWMFRAQLDLGVASPDYEDCVIEAEHAVDGVQFHCWGTNVDQTFDAAFMEYDSYDYYGVNVALRDDQIITGAQWILHQKDVGYKYSTDFNKFGDSSNNHLDKDSTFVAIEWQYNHNWVDGKWTPYTDYGNPCYTLQMHIQGQEEVDMVKEPQAGIFAARGMVHSVEGKWIEMISGGSVQLKHSFKEMLDEDSLALVHGGSDQWTYLNDLGTYDIILGNGHTSIKKHSVSEEYIYLVGSDITPETAIYSFGESGFEGFGSWPGTRLKNVAGAVQVQGEDLKYQGSSKYIWKVTLEIGYPKADHIILASVNEYDVVGLQTANMPLARKRSFHFVQNLDDHDDLEGSALDWLLETEAVRKAATNESVCSVSKEDAIDAINVYQSLGGYMQSEYIDCTQVNTWTDNTRTEKGYVSYRNVVLQLAKIAEIDLGETNTTVSFGYQTNGTMLIAIISIITVASVAGVVALVVIRKRKHQ